MKKTRVPEGDQYFYVGSTGIIKEDWDELRPIDNERFENSNYFHTRKEAEAMARKLRAVLNGADVIETPSDKDIEEAMKRSVTESILCVAPYESFTPKATDLLECAWTKGAEWVKSKIIK